MSKITKNDLERYTNLKELYLTDNSIATISNDAFAEQNKLTVLSLSQNGLMKLPVNIFKLPSLEHLYLANLPNVNIKQVIEEAKSITSPLITLDMSGDSGNGYPNYELPDLGIMPHLTNYRISGNELLTISPRHFAGLCKLQTLHSHNVNVVNNNNNNSCDCWTVNRWLEERKVNFTKFNCKKNSNNNCPLNVSVKDLNAYETCKTSVQQIDRKQFILKIILPIIIAVIILAIVLSGIVCFHRKKRRKRQEKTDMLNGSKAISLQEQDQLCNVVNS